MDSKTVEQILLDHRLPNLLPEEEGWIIPHYQGLSIANLPATISALLGSSLPGALPPLPDHLWKDWTSGLRRVVLIVLDALGYRLLQHMMARGDGQILSDLSEVGYLLPLTSVFPSTTDAALVSLRTGRSPAEHGWLAYTLYLRELGIASNAILLSPIWSRQSDLLVDWGLEPENLVTVPTLAQQLAANGVATHALFHRGFRDSGFTSMLYRDVKELHVHLHASDFWVQLRSLLAETQTGQVFVTAYWSGLDTLGHAYGPDTEQWEAEFRSITHLLEHELLSTLSAAQREGTLLLITADHGQISIPPDQVLSANDYPELGRHFMVPITGESRAAFIHPRPGQAGPIREFLENRFPGWFVVLDSVKALEAGLLGLPVTDETYARAGELLVLPKGNHAIQQKSPPVPTLGRHGGLSPEEMLVPLIGCRLEGLA
jgi:predicted AlkP superfamily pyrophosphatase or phosphodiesterase